MFIAAGIMTVLFGSFILLLAWLAYLAWAASPLVVTAIAFGLGAIFSFFAASEIKSRE